MRTPWAAIVLAVTGCVSSTTETCVDGRVCAEGRVCASVGGDTFCIDPSQRAACDGRAPLEPCGMALRCYEGVCLPAGCGNARLDPEEACDDGNNTSGDGCSADCSSDETCGNGVVDSITAEQCDDGPASSTSSFDGCASSCVAETARWDRMPYLPELMLARPATAYDANRDRIVLVGQERGLGKTLEWDGRRWMLQTPPIEPLAREGHAIAYDADRHRVVMFGGVGLGDTWEWDGGTWSLKFPTTSPSGRNGHVMAYDPRTRRVVLYGGKRGPASQPTLLGDTWVWDGETWTQLADGPPTGRHDAAMAYDPRRGVITLFGGATATGVSSETWELSGSSWTLREPAVAPPPRQLHALAFDPGSGRLLLHGGRSATSTLGDTWGWDGEAWALLATGVPAAKPVLMTMAREGAVVLHTLDRSYRWDGGGWSSERIIVPAPPVARHAGALDPIRSPRGRPRRAQPELPLGDDAGLDRRVVGRSGCHARRAARREDGVRCAAARVRVFGGRRADGTASDQTWVFDGTSWLPRAPSMPPPARSGHGLVYDSARAQIVLFGGSDDGGAALDDTWLWDGVAWTEVTPLDSPAARAEAALTYDPVAGVVVLFGGYGGAGQGPLDDTWLWTGTSWARQAVAGPAPRGLAGMAWDPARQRSVLFGGTGDVSVFNDQWEWDGSDWRQLPLATPLSLRFGHLMTTALDGSGVMSFGGTLPNASTFEEVAWLHWRGSSVAETCVPADLDGDTLAGCADPDCWQVCTPLCPPGVACAAPTVGCGDGSCDGRRESCVTCPEDCGSCAATCGNFTCEASESAASCPGDCR